MTMKTLLILFGGFLIGIASVYAGTRTEVAFDRMTICITADTIGGLNKVLVNGTINLDNGAVSRTIGYDIYPFLTAGQKAQLKTDFLAALRIVSNKEDVPTPIPTTTP